MGDRHAPDLLAMQRVPAMKVFATALQVEDSAGRRGLSNQVMRVRSGAREEADERDGEGRRGSNMERPGGRSRRAGK